MTVSFAKFESMDWTMPPLPPDLPAHLVEEAKGVRRKGLAAGEAGFFASHVQMPAGQVTVPHSHDHGELVVVLDGSMEFDGGEGAVTMSKFDAATITAGQVYGFTVGPEGVSFLLVRAQKAVSTLASSPGASGG